MMIVKANKDSEAGKMPSEALLAAMAKYNEELVNAGILVDLAGLQSSSKGFRVRFSGGKTSIIDGPFAETKELIAGYWVINVKSRQEAVDWPEKFPHQRLEREGENRGPSIFRAGRFCPGEAVDHHKEVGKKLAAGKK